MRFSHLQHAFLTPLACVSHTSGMHCLHLRHAFLALLACISRASGTRSHTSGAPLTCTRARAHVCVHMQDAMAQGLLHLLPPPQLPEAEEPSFHLQQNPSQLPAAVLKAGNPAAAPPAAHPWPAQLRAPMGLAQQEEQRQGRQQWGTHWQERRWQQRWLLPSDAATLCARLAQSRWRPLPGWVPALEVRGGCDVCVCLCLCMRVHVFECQVPGRAGVVLPGREVKQKGGARTRAAAFSMCNLMR